MTQNRSFNTGSNIFGNYNVVIERVQSAQHIGESMYPARYFGRIEDLDGNIIKYLGEAGMTSPSIKKFIGKPLEANPRVSSGSISNRRDKKLLELNRAKMALEAVGMDIMEVDTLISLREAEIAAEQEAQRVEQEAQREAKKAAKKQEKEAAAAKKELKKLQAAKKALEAIGMDTTDIDAKIALLQ
jgi:hypothetical protein